MNCLVHEVLKFDSFSIFPGEPFDPIELLVSIKQKIASYDQYQMITLFSGCIIWFDEPRQSALQLNW